SNNFIKTKLLELLGFKEIKQDETLENYGDTTINKLALDLANYNQKIIKTASGGGGFKTNLYG
ncbi:TPA: 3-oxoacyl-ACP synthase, partial [Campylobacter jejuni]